MSCCGQRRREVLGSIAASTPSGSGARTPAAAALRAPVTLRYRGIGPFAGRGARTGRLYLCPGTGGTVQVEQADADALLRTKRFTRN